MKQVILWNGCLTLTLIFWIFHVWDFDFCISALVHKIWIKSFKKWSLILKGSSFKCITFSAIYHPMYWCYNPQQIQERFFFSFPFKIILCPISFENESYLFRVKTNPLSHSSPAHLPSYLLSRACWEFLGDSRFTSICWKDFETSELEWYHNLPSSMISCLSGTLFW